MSLPYLRRHGVTVRIERHGGGIALYTMQNNRVPETMANALAYITAR